MMTKAVNASQGDKVRTPTRLPNMSKCMNEQVSIADLAVADLMAAIGSTDITPGAGSAAAVTVALATACASKAVAMSLKHHASDNELQSANESLKRISRFALIGADRDAEAFRAFIKERNPSTTNELLQEIDQVTQLIEALLTIIRTIERRVAANMSGDLIAAKALAEAAHKIQSANERETEKARKSSMTQSKHG